MNEVHIYDVDINWLEGRKGIMQSDALDDKIEVVTPPEFANGIPRVWSPEHLFVAAAGSCFMTTFLAVAEKSRLEFLGFSCKASGILEQRNDLLMITQLTLQPQVKVSNQELVIKGLKVLEKSHRSCLILNSVKSEIIFKPHVEIQDSNSSQTERKSQITLLENNS